MIFWANLCTRRNFEIKSFLFYNFMNDLKLKNLFIVDIFL